MKFLYAAHPAHCLVFEGPLIAAFAAAGARPGWASAIAWYALGGAAWTLIEYVLHRFVFHFVPRNPRLRQAMQRLHLQHHLDVNDLTLLSAGPLLVVPSAGVFYGLAVALTRSAQNGANLMVGVLVGHLVYEWIHYRIHLPGKKFGPVMTALRKHHLLHHHADWKKRFGVTTPLWDAVFRTSVSD